jgi:hypothetical protein
MAIEITPQASITDTQALKIAELYWSRLTDGNWAHTVKELGSLFVLPTQQISKVAAETSTASDSDFRCASCDQPLSAKSRSEFHGIISRVVTQCIDCTRREQERRITAAAEQRRVEQERRSAIWLRETSFDRPFDYQKLEYLDACYAFIILTTSMFDEKTGEIRLPDADSFSPDSRELQRVVISLYQQGVLLVGKKTSPEAFIPSEDSRSYEYYPARISWRFALPKVSGTHTSLLGELSRIVDRRDDTDDYSKAVSRLWWDIAQAEGIRYLSEQLDQYNLSIDESELLREAIRYTLMHFSIPQLRNLIWRLAKDTTLYATKREIHPRRAINAVPGNLMRMCDRVIANAQPVRPYVLKWDEQECSLTTTLFDRLLRTGADGFRTLNGESLKALQVAEGAF